MKFLGKGTPVGQKVVENDDVKKRAEPLSLKVRLQFLKMLHFQSPHRKSYKSKHSRPAEWSYSAVSTYRDSDVFSLYSTTLGLK